MKFLNKTSQILFLSIALFACEKMIINAPEIINEEDLGQPQQVDTNILLKGNFKGAAHPTSGLAQIIVDNGVKKLKFSNFKTDAGPDLRIYLAEDANSTNFIEISNKIENGNLLYLLPDEVNIEKQTHVLIWCKLFKVNFGTAVLRKPEV